MSNPRKPLTREQYDCLRDLKDLLFARQNPNATIPVAIDAIQKCPRAAAQLYSSLQNKKK